MAKKIVNDPNLMDSEHAYQPSLTDEIMRVGEDVVMRIPHVLKQAGVGALETASMLSPVMYKDTGEGFPIKPIVPGAASLPYGYIGMGLDAATGIKLPGYDKALRQQQYLSENYQDVIGTTAPQNVGDAILRSIPSLFTPATTAPVAGNIAQKTLKYGLDFLAPINWTGSKAIAGVGSGLVGAAAEGLDALIDNDEYKSVFETINLPTADYDFDKFTPEDKQADPYTSVDKNLEYDTIAQLQDEGDPAALATELPNKVQTKFVDFTPDGQLDLVDATPEMEKAQYFDDFNVGQAVGIAVGTGLALIAGNAVKNAFKHSSFSDMDGFIGKTSSDDINIGQEVSTASATANKAKEAMVDRFAKTEQVSKVAQFTKRQMDNLEFQQRTRLNPGATQAQLSNMFKSGEQPDKTGVNWLKMREIPKRVFDDFAATDPTTKSAVRSFLIINNQYNEALQAGRAQVTVPGPNGPMKVSTHALRFRLQQLRQVPRVIEFEKRFGRMFQDMIPFMHEHGLIDWKTRNDWMTNRGWYHPMTMAFEDSPELTNSNFINSILRDLDGEGGSLYATNQHLMGRHQDVLNIGPGDFADPIMTGVKYLENIPRMAFYNTWRRDFIDATLASQVPIAKKIFTNVKNLPKSQKHRRIISIYRDGVKEDYHVADKQVYNLLLMKPEKFGVLSKTFDSIRQAKQLTITGALRFGSFLKHSIGYESVIVGLTAPKGRYTGALDQLLQAAGAPSVSSLSRGMLMDPTMGVPFLNTLTMLPIGVSRDLYGRTMFRFKNTVEFGLNNPGTKLGKMMTAIQQATGNRLNLGSLANIAANAYENSTYHLAQRAGLYHPNMALNPTIYDNRTLLKEVSSSLYKMFPKQGPFLKRLLDNVFDSGSNFIRPLTIMMEAGNAGPRLQYLALNYKKGMSQRQLQQLLYEAKHTLGDVTDAGVNHGSLIGNIGQAHRTAGMYYRPSIQALTAVSEAALRAPTETAMRLSTTAVMGLGAIAAMSAMIPGYWDYYWNKMTPEDRAMKMPVPRLKDMNAPVTEDNVEYIMSNYDPLLGLVMSPLIETVGAMGNTVGSDQQAFRDMFQNWGLSFTDLEVNDMIQGAKAATGRAVVSGGFVGVNESLAAAGARLNITGKEDPDANGWLKPIYHQSLDPSRGRTYNSALPESFENFITAFAGTVGYSFVNSLNQLTYDLTGEDSFEGEKPGALQALGDAATNFVIGASEGSYTISPEQRIRMLDGVGKVVRRKLNVIEALETEMRNKIVHPHSPTADMMRPAYTPEMAATVTRHNMDPKTQQLLLNMQSMNGIIKPLKDARTDIRKKLDLMYADPKLFKNPRAMRETENDLVEEFRTVNADLYNTIKHFEEEALLDTPLEELLEQVRASK